MDRRSSELNCDSSQKWHLVFFFTWEPIPRVGSIDYLPTYFQLRCNAALHATRNKALCQLLLSRCNAALHATRNKALCQLLLSIRLLQSPPNGKRQETLVISAERNLFLIVRTISTCSSSKTSFPFTTPWMMADWSPFLGPWEQKSHAHDGWLCSQAQPRKVAATVAERPALWLWRFLLPTRAARSCSSSTACQREEEEKTPLQSPKEIVYFLTKLRATTDKGPRSTDQWIQAFLFVKKL